MVSAMVAVASGACHVASAHEWLGFYQRFWNSRLDLLEQLLRDEGVAEKNTRKAKSKGDKL